MTQQSSKAHADDVYLETAYGVFSPHKYIDRSKFSKGSHHLRNFTDRHIHSPLFGGLFTLQHPHPQPQPVSTHPIMCVKKECPTCRKSHPHASCSTDHYYSSQTLQPTFSSPSPSPSHYFTKLAPSPPSPPFHLLIFPPIYPIPSHHFLPSFHLSIFPNPLPPAKSNATLTLSKPHREIHLVGLRQPRSQRHGPAPPRSALYLLAPGDARREGVSAHDGGGAGGCGGEW